MPKHLSIICFILLCLVATPKLSAQPESHDDNDAPVPPSATFNKKEFQPGEHKLAGRLSLRRQFLGTRSTPPFQDIVQFNLFDGNEVRFLTFENSQLDNELKQQLLKSYSLPVSLDVQLTEKTVGHDRLNMSKRIVGEISDCQIHSADAMLESAKSAGSSDTSIQQFKSALTPEANRNCVIANMGQIFIHSEAARQGSGLSISGIAVFNSNKEPAKIKIKKLWSEQDGKKHQYTLNKRSASEAWEIAGQSWSDGIYETGKSPKKLWRFEPDSPIAPSVKVTVYLELQINGEVVTLKRQVTPK